MRVLGYRTKTLLHFTLLTVAITSLLMTLHMGYLFYGVMNANKVFLKRMCRNVRKELIQEKLQLDAPLPKHFARTLDVMLRIFDERASLHCAILYNDGAVAYQNAPFSIQLTPDHFGPAIPPVAITATDNSREHRKFFINGVQLRGDDLLDSLQTWHVMERLTIEGGNIFIETDCHFELVERFIEGCLIAFLATLLLLVALQAVFRKNIFSPLADMQNALQEIRKGNLASRIPQTGTHDELDIFIQQLNDTLKDLENAFTELRRFSSDAAHELRTPLTIIRGHLEVCLAKQRSAEEYQTVISQVLEECLSLAKMVEILLLMTRMECHTCPKSPQDISVIAENATMWADMLAEEKGQTIHTDIQQKLIAHAVPELIKLLFRNLLHNAIKYSPEGSDIVFSLKQVDDSVQCRIQDNGIGIAKDALKLIFNRFYRGNHEKNTGYGLGLALVKHIVEYHGGTITVDSTAGHGSVFTVILPATISENTPTEVLS